VKYDPYDTDAGSIDTTARESMVHINDKQETGHNYDKADGDEEYEDEDDEDGHGDKSDKLPWDEDEIQFLEKTGFLGVSQLEQFNHLASNGFREPTNPAIIPDSLGGDDSYPTTTSGLPDGVSHSLHGDEEHGSDAFEDGSHISPSPQRPTAANIYHRQPAQGSFHRPVSAARMVPSAQPEVNLFQQSAVIRSNNRSDTHVNTQMTQHPHGNDPSLQSQPPSYSQVTGQPISTPIENADMKPNIHSRTNQTLPQGSASRRAPKLVEPSAPAGYPSHDKQQMPIILLTPHQTEGGPSNYETEFRSVEDYDRPALFDMDYRQLSNEDFDTVPRALPAVLSDDMLKRPLTERLEYVQKSLDATDQGKFFGSLSTAEWEDAGDWFLDQFSAIINRTKEARQFKRKLAIDFENEVEKRHKRVTKKHRQVDVSLDNMKARGQGLIPKSPGRV
jgi:hypothetical protein